MRHWHIEATTRGRAFYDVEADTEAEAWKAVDDGEAGDPSASVIVAVEAVECVELGADV